jgi:hypothetical protein
MQFAHMQFAPELTWGLHASREMIVGILRAAVIQLNASCAINHEFLVFQYPVTQYVKL